MKDQKEKTNGKVPKFLTKLYQLCQNEVSSDVVGWDSITSSFIIFDLQTFIEKLLVKYYNNPNMNSFIRQVNNYGFSKIPRGDGLYQYHNKHFVLGKWESLYKVKRVSTSVHRDDSCDYGSGDKECSHCSKVENRLSKLENTVVYLVNQIRELKLINQSLNSYICNKKMVESYEKTEFNPEELLLIGNKRKKKKSEANSQQIKIAHKDSGYFGDYGNQDSSSESEESLDDIYNEKVYNKKNGVKNKNDYGFDEF